MWSEKHKPRTLDEFVGKTAVEFIRSWDGKPLVVHGSTGTGKSLLVELIAKERGWDIIHIDNDNLQTAKNAAATQSLFGNRKLIVIENVEHIRRGGVAEASEKKDGEDRRVGGDEGAAKNPLKYVSELIEETKSPLILTTDDYGSKRLATIKKSCQDLQLRKQLPASIAKYLAEVCRKEGVECPKEVLEAIAKSSGELRSALNDLEAAAGGKKSVTQADLEVLGGRDKTSDIYRALSIIFGGRNLEEVVRSTWNLEEQPENVLWWIEENVPLLYQDKYAQESAISNIAKADVFLGRIRRRQYWGFLRYANPLMTAGVNVSRPEKISFARYQLPTYFISMGKSKRNRGVENAISGKISPHLHVSNKVFAREYIPLLRIMLKTKRITPVELQEQYRLEDEEIEYLTA